MQSAIVIPARYGSTRFPGKPLATLAGRPIIAHVLEKAQAAGAEQVVVATDDTRIQNVVEELGGRVVMSAPDLPSGTARVAAAVQQLTEKPDIVINVQGDEPFVSPLTIRQLLQFMRQPQVKIGTLQSPITTPAWLEDPNKVKVVTNQQQEALYFSRSPIPHIRGTHKEDWVSQYPYHLHVGMYGFTTATLLELMALPPSRLAAMESLEQLQWLDHGYRIHVATTAHTSFGIDTPADLEAAEAWLQKKAR